MTPKHSLSVSLVCGSVVAFALAMPLLTGCASKPTDKSDLTKLTANPKPPPGYPAKKDVPLDEGLRLLAQREIDAALQDSDPVIRCNGVDAAQRTLGVEARKQIVEALNDSDALVRFAGCLACGQLGLAEAKPRLMELVDDPESHSVQAGSRFALHKLGDTRYSHGLETLARDPSSRVRGNVAMCLGLLGEPTGLRVLRGMINDPDPTVRLQVAEAMWMLADEWALDTLVAGTVSGYPDDQIICILALAAPHDPRVIENIRGQLTSDYLEVSLAAARAMGELGSDEGYGVAMKGAKSKDARQRSMAALAFGAIGRRDAQPILAELIKDGEQSVRLAAATAILELK